MLALQINVLYDARMNTPETKYTSTRDLDGNTHGFSDVLLAGLAPDGGLFVPTEYPTITIDELAHLSDKPYSEVFTYVNAKFVGGDIALDTQRRMAEAAYSPDKFTTTGNGNVTPLTWLTPTLAVQQLSNGPTAAFKDMAMQPLSQYMQYELARRNQKLTILGATSGDTGSSAEAAMKGLSGISVIMMSPLEGMTRFQRMQMGALSGGNISNISVDGRFDDCQDMVKELNALPEFADLGAVNSINWARVAAQVTYYINGYSEAVKGNIGQQIDFVVPTGNFGNVLAGYVAKKMGLPIRYLVVATNENDVLDKTIKTGVYQPQKKALETSSPSMDISKASNFERFVFDALGRNPQTMRAYIETLRDKGSVSFAQFEVANSVMKEVGFRSGKSTHANRLNAIRWAHTKGMLIDPHTADAVTVANNLISRGALGDVPVVCLSTALPDKFDETIREAGIEPVRSARFAKLESSVAANAGAFSMLAAGDLEGLARHVREHRAV